MRTVAFDTETRGLDAFDPNERAFLASWADADGEYATDLSDPEGLGRFAAAIEGAERIVAHNMSFDVHQLRESTGIDLLKTGALLEDTDLMSRVLLSAGQQRGGHGLKKLGAVYVRGDAGDSEKEITALAESIGTKLKTTGGFYDVWRAYPEQLEFYARMDARLTYDLFSKFEHDLTGDLRRCYELERRVMPVLIRAEQRGVRVDGDAVAVLHDEYTAEAERLHGELEGELGATALNGRGSEEALLESLQKLGVPLHRRTASGKLATNKFALQEFEDDYPILAKLGEYRTATKFLSTYIGPMQGRDVVHPSFMQCGAWTGRMSCTRPNMQNIPKRAGKGVRRMFVPRDGHVFIVFDYESIEVRLLAHYLNSPEYRKLIDDGHDPHAWMATQIHGGEPGDYAKGTPGQPLRDAAKNTLFAITYGAGAPRISDMNKISREQAKTLISQIKSSLPNYYRFSKRVKDKIIREGYVTTLYGRKQPVATNKAYVGVNALIQGSAADIMKQGLVNVDEAVRPLGATPLLVVHDEVVVEVPAEHATEAHQLIEQALTEAYPLVPRLAVSGSIVSTNYADA